MNYCLGTVQFGLKYGIQNNDRPTKDLVFKILDRALENGINTFDTAYAYGDSESILGDYLKEHNINSDSVNIITKISSDVLNTGNGDVSKDILEKCAVDSLKRLKIEKIYGLLFHDSKVVYEKEKMETIVNLKNSKFVKKIGVSIYTPDEALEAVMYDIDIIQVPYNLFDNRLDKIDFFNIAKRKNIEIYARSSLLQGLALMDYNKLPNNVLFAKNYLVEFDNLCKKYNIEKLNAAVNYVSSNEYIDYIVFGADNIEQLNEYLSIRDNKLPKEFIFDIKDVFKDSPEKLVNPTLWK